MFQLPKDILASPCNLNNLLGSVKVLLVNSS